MPFLSTKPKLDLDSEVLAELCRIARARTEPQSWVERAHILLDFYNGSSISEIARTYSITRATVNKQINKCLQLGALASLNDLPRSGKPATITDEAKQWVISIACTKPLEHGYSPELWTMDLLASHVRKHCEEANHPCLKRFSKGTASKLLSSDAIKPHKIKYYLERRDPEFDQKMRQVLCVYREVMIARDTKTDELVAYISYDEKPGIQAIENTAPDLMPVLGEYSSVARDYEYKRHGTLSLLAGIDLLTGVITATVEDRHRSIEFIGFLKCLDEKYPEHTKLKIILDNHSAHISKETRGYLATRPNRFDFIFTPTHASGLNIIETFFGKLARSLFRYMRTKTKSELKKRILQHIDYLNESPVVFHWTWKMDEEEEDAGDAEGAD
jgi:transposase